MALNIGGNAQSPLKTGSSFLGGMAGGLLDGIGSLFTIGAQKRAATRAFKRQKQFAREVFDYTNAYNTPKAQMDRLKAAGLNPALMYGQGNVGNAQAMTASAPMAQVQGPSLAQSTAAGAQISLLNSQRKLNENTALLQMTEAKRKGYGDKQLGNYFSNELGIMQAEQRQKQADVNLKAEQQAGIMIDNEINLGTFSRLRKPMETTANVFG